MRVQASLGADEAVDLDATAAALATAIAAAVVGIVTNPTAVKISLIVEATS